MRTLAILALLLTACSGCDNAKPETQSFGLQFVSGTLTPHVNAQIPYQFNLVIRITGRGHAVQTLTSGNAMLCEAFTLGADDLHIGTCGETRTMTISQASLSGVALNGSGYGVIDAFPLAGNPFNSTGLPVGGAYTAYGPALQWSIKAEPAGVTVTLPDRVIFIPKP